MRTVFFGTPEFAVPALRAMVGAGYAPHAVITRPARPVGRGYRLQDPPVAAWARAHGLEVRQPEKVNVRSFRAALAQAAPDVAVVVAFGQIFRRRLLALPRHGCLNLHASLLPGYRGAAPIQAAIAAGETVTGVTTMVMDEGLDTGPMLLRAELEIGPAETAPELAGRLAARGAALMVETLRAVERGGLVPRQQDHDRASYAPQLTKADGIVDWRRPAVEIYNRLRAYTPWPGQWARLRGKRVKLISASPLAERAEGLPGTVRKLRQPSPGGGPTERRRAEGQAEVVLPVVCGGGTLLGLRRVQLAGKKPVTAADFANGERLRPGERFSERDML